MPLALALAISPELGVWLATRLRLIFEVLALEDDDIADFCVDDEFVAGAVCVVVALASFFFLWWEAIATPPIMEAARTGVKEYSSHFFRFIRFSLTFETSSLQLSRKAGVVNSFFANPVSLS